MDQTVHTVGEMRSQGLPKISGFGQITTSDDDVTQLPDSNQLVIRAQQTMFQGGRIASDINRLKRLQESAAADLDVKKLEIALLVEQSYFRAIADQEQLDLWAQAKSEYNDLLQLIEPKFTVGSVPEYDYVKIRLSIAQYEIETLNLEQDLAHTLFVLGAAMGGDAPSDVQPLASAPPPPEISLDNLLAMLPARPDVRSAEKHGDAQELAVQRATREHWPDLTIMGDYGYSGIQYQDIGTGWEFSAMANLPIFDFGTIHHHIEQAQADRTAQDYRTKALRLKIRTEMNDARQHVKTAWQSLVIAEQSLPQAEKAYKNSLRRYRSGLAPMTELSDAHDLLTQSQVRTSQYTNEYRNALSELVSVQGLLPGQQK